MPMPEEGVTSALVVDHVVAQPPVASVDQAQAMLHGRQVAATSMGRLRSIDALRGLGALGVVLFHARGAAGLHSTDGFARLVSAFLSFGRYGVWLFFVVSGFCIHQRWVRQSQLDPAARLDFVSFWKRRLYRLYPPFFVALVIYLVCLTVWGGFSWNRITMWRVGRNLFLVNNFDAASAGAINGVFWTLAIEEQLYLAYFVLVRLRVRFGWTMTLCCAFLARVSWFMVAMALHRMWRIDVLVVESAASQWFIWTLGALAVEGACGRVSLPAWTRNAWLGTGILGLAAGITYGYTEYLPGGPLKTLCWFFGDMIWGVGFFLWVNWAVTLERQWQHAHRVPRLAAWLASLGIFSYSLYLTHEIVLEHLWPRLLAFRPQLFGELSPLAGLLGLTLASVAFAWCFFRVFEKPFLSPRRPPAIASA